MHLSSNRTLVPPALGSMPAPIALIGSALPANTLIRPVTPKLTEARLMDMEREAYQKGFDSGERAGREMADIAAQKMMASLSALKDQVAVLRKQIVRDAEREVVNLALAVARQAIGYELENDQPVVLAGIAAAREHFGPNTPLSVRVSPEDHTRLQGQWAPLLDALGDGLSLTASEQIDPGGAHVEASGKLIDASLITRFEQVVAGLIEAPQ